MIPAMIEQANNPTMPGWQFASDNTSAICPEALSALVEANVGAAASYGNDDYTAAAAERLREIFEADCEVYFVFNGTAANSLAVASCCLPHHSVICANVAHMETDECGGPEFFSGGAKLLLAESRHGKLDPQSTELIATRRTDIHFPKPRLLSLTLPTELGGVYTLRELETLRDLARRLRLHVHVDGARFANAVAALQTTPAQVIRSAGADVLCLGGSKNGLPIGEAMVFFNRDLAAEFDYRCKQAGQLASKMRFLTAPWLGVLQYDAWLKHAAHANSMAQRLAQGLATIPGVNLRAPVDANAVFVDLPPAVHERLAEKGWRYYSFIGEGAARFMCSWATTDAEISALVDDAVAAVKNESRTVR